MSEMVRPRTHRIGPRFIWSGVLLFVTGAEAAVAADALRFAVIVLILTMLALIWYASRAAFIDRTFALALTLVPLLHVLSLSLPLERLSSYFWSLLVCVPAFSAVVVLIQLLGLIPAELNLTLERFFRQLLVGLWGIPLGIVAYLLLRPSYPLAESFGEGIIAVASLFLAGMLDEIVFRGVLQEIAGAALSRRWRHVYVSALYAALQIETRSVITVLFAFVVSIAFAQYVQRTRSVLGVGMMHVLANIVMYLVLPTIVRGQGR